MQARAARVGCHPTWLTTYLLRPTPVLQACQRKKREVSMRAFASYNPLEEYQLETSELFAQLLLGESRLTAHASCSAAVPAIRAVCAAAAG